MSTNRTSSTTALHEPGAAAATARSVPLDGPTAESYGELTAAYAYFNAALFDGRLPGALITLTRKNRTLGYFSRARFASHDRRRADEIAMNPCYFAVCTIQDVLSTMAHEMTHQWQHHFGTVSRGRYHNAEWADRMEAIGLMPSHTGKPGGRRTGDQMDHYIIPHGPFDRHCAALLTENFRLSWYDRFPPSVLDHHLALDEPVVTTAVNAAAEPQQDSIIIAGVAVAVANPVAPLLPDRAAIFAALDLVQPPAAPGVVPSSNRVKYSCTGCRTNVWGKPGLHIACCDCDLPFEPGA